MYPSLLTQYLDIMAIDLKCVIEVLGLRIHPSTFIMVAYQHEVTC